MKKLLTILLMFACFWANAQTGENPPAGAKMLQTPNNPTFQFNPPDTSIWISMGVYGKTKLARANKKYSIWDHTGISNVGWGTNKVLGFNVDGNLIPMDASGSFPGFGTTHDKAAYGDHDHSTVYAPLSIYPSSGLITGYLPYKTGTVLANSIISTDGTYIGINQPTPIYKLDLIGGYSAVAARMQRYASFGEILQFGRSGIYGTSGIGTGAASGSVLGFYSDGILSGYIYSDEFWTNGNFNTNTGYQKNGVSLLLDWSRTGYAGSSGQYLKSQGINTTPIWTDFPTSLPASDVYAWAKASIKPTYTYSEVGAAPSSTVSFPGFGTNHTTSAYGDHDHTGTYEPVLGNPGSNGYVLSSTTGGVRSWVANSSYSPWSISTDGVFRANINSGGNLNLIAGTNVSLSASGSDITINSSAGGGTTTNAVTFNNSGTGAASGTTFNGSVARTISYNTIGAAALAGSSAQSFSASDINVTNGGTFGTSGITIGTKRISLSGNTMYFGNVDGSLNMTFDTSTGTLYAPNFSGVSGMVYPGAGIPVSTGSAWGTSITNNSSNWNDAYTNMGKVLLFGTTTYGNLSANYFEWDTNSFRIKRDGTPQQNSVLPITSGGVYDALALKADLSGAAFTGAISSTSTMTATDFILSSDKRLKRDISPIKCNWSDKIEFVQYRMKSDPLKLRYGVIAQQVEKYMPELVSTDGRGMKAVSYIDLLIAKIADLENRIKQLENER